MADALSAFVVSLGLDPTDYNREIAKYRDDRKRLAEEDAKYNRQSNDGQKRQVEAMRSLRNETAGFLLTLAGASSVGSFFKEMVIGAANTGRLAENLGIATERVGVWEKAVERAGGTAENAQNALRTMASLYQSNKLGLLDPGTQGDLMGLGISKLSQNPEENLFAISRAATRMDRQQFIARASRLGLDQGTINVLAEGPDQLRATLAEMEKLNATTKKEAEEAQKLERAWHDLSDTLKTIVRPAIFEAVTDLNGFAAQILKFGNALKGWEFRDPWEVLKEQFNNSGFGGNAPKPEDREGVYVNEENKPWYRRLWDTITRKTGAAPAPATGRGVGGASRGGEGRGDRTSKTVENYFRAKGYSPAQAKGIAAAVVAEGGLRQRTGGGYRGRALGIGQLLGERRQRFLARYGSNFTLQNELDFMHYELQGGDPGGKAVLDQTTEQGTLNAMVRDFYRPKKGAETHGDLRRGMAHLARRGELASSRVPRAGTRAAANNNQTTNVGTIVINTDGKSAEQISKNIRQELSKRGLTTQANTGLQP